MYVGGQQRAFAGLEDDGCCCGLGGYMPHLSLLHAGSIAAAVEMTAE